MQHRSIPPARSVIFHMLLTSILIAGTLFSPGAVRRVDAAPTSLVFIPLIPSDGEISVQNPSSSPMTLALGFFRNGYSYGQYPVGDGSLQPGETATVKPEDMGLSAGEYQVKVVSGDTVSVAVRFHGSALNGDTLATYTPSDQDFTEAAFGPFYQNASGFNSRLVLMNTTANYGSVFAQYYDQAGRWVGATVSKSISPNSAVEFSPDDIPTAPATFIGSIKISASSVRLAGILIQSSSTSISSQPVLWASTPPLEGTSSNQYSVPRLFKQVNQGPGTLTSSLVLYNPGASITATVQYFLTGQSEPSLTKPYPLAANALTMIPPESALAAGKSYSAVVTCDTPLGVGEETRFTGGTGFPAGSFKTNPAQQVSSPGLLLNSKDYSEIYLQNMGTAPTVIKVELLQAEGGLPIYIAPTSLLSPGSSARVNLADIPELNQSFDGSLIASSLDGIQPIVVQVDRYEISELVYPVYIPNVSSGFTPDPYFDKQQDMRQIGADQAWKQGIVGNSSVIVAVIDSGVDLDHPDLVANILPGVDYIDGDYQPDDANGHGTNVAGIVAAALNGVGVIGVAPQVKILPMRVLDENGSGNDADVAAAIVEAVNRGARVINMSLGGSYSTTLAQAVADAQARGALVIAAAGNCGDPSTYYVNGCETVDEVSYPAALKDVMAIAAVDKWDQQAVFSNSGNYLSVSAPGVSIFNDDMGGSYQWISGTSQATPHVAGLAALVWSQKPGLTALQVKTAIEKTAADLGSSGWDNRYGYGRINVMAALNLATSGALSIASDDVQNQALPVPAENRSIEIIPGQVIVGFVAGTSQAQIDRVLESTNAQIEGEIPGLGLLRLRVPTGQEWQIIDQLRALPQVESANPDNMVYAQ